MYTVARSFSLFRVVILASLYMYKNFTRFAHCKQFYEFLAGNDLFSPRILH